MSAVNVEPAADAAESGLPRKAGTLFRHICPAVLAINHFAAIFLVSLVGGCDNAVVVGFVEECQMRALASFAFFRACLNTSTLASSVFPFRLAVVARVRLLEWCYA